MTPDTDTVWDDLPAAARDLPPSCKLVLVTLHHEGPLLFRDLRAETQLPKSTLRTALRQCREADYVETQPSNTEPNLKEYKTCSPCDHS